MFRVSNELVHVELGTASGMYAGSHKDKDLLQARQWDKYWEYETEQSSYKKKMGNWTWAKYLSESID